MDHGDAFGFREFDDAFVIQIGADWAFRGIELVSFVCFEAMDGEAIFLGENGNRAETELGGGAENTDRDFTTVGGEEFTRLGWA
jgi:hypothetical protein